jgi:hypothetical protein
LSAFAVRVQYFYSINSYSLKIEYARIGRKVTVLEVFFPET